MRYLLGRALMTTLSLAAAQSITVLRDVERNVAGHARLAGAAAEEGARLVLFPELSLTGYDRAATAADAIAPDDRRLQPLRDAARTRGVTIVAGAPIASPRGLHIGALVFSPTGVVQTYLKQYLHEGEEVAFTPGPGGSLLRIDDEVVALAICADITHPEHARENVDRGATVYAAGCLIMPNGYETDAALLRQRARDHGVLVLMANYGARIGDWPSAGRSAIWTSDGSVLACAPASGEALVIAERAQNGWTGTVVRLRDSRQARE